MNVTHSQQQQPKSNEIWNLLILLVSYFGIATRVHSRPIQRSTHILPDLTSSILDTLAREIVLIPRSLAGFSYLVVDYAVQRTDKQQQPRRVVHFRF